MLKSSLCNYSDAYILAKGTVSVTNMAYREVIFKNCAPLTYLHKQSKQYTINNAKDIDVVISMYNLIEYSDDY